jgi:hypothetical protein
MSGGFAQEVSFADFYKDSLLFGPDLPLVLITRAALQLYKSRHWLGSYTPIANCAATLET